MVFFFLLLFRLLFIEYNTNSHVIYFKFPTLNPKGGGREGGERVGFVFFIFIYFCRMT